MPGNSFGKIFRLTTFGESHGVAIGGIIDGCPAGIPLDLEMIQQELDRRRPGQSAIVTQRKEPDTVEFLSGIFEGKTTGTPIGFEIRNANQKSKDYSHIKDTYRPSHADYTYDEKYGVRDYRGGGRSSARETASRVVAGSIAKQLLKDVKITAFVTSVGDMALKKPISIILKNNRLYIIEIATRLSGGFWSTMSIPLVYRINLIEKAILLALGLKTKPPPKQLRHYCYEVNRYIFPNPGIIKNITKPPREKIPKYVTYFEVNAKVGDRVYAITNHPMRKGRIQVIGKTRNQCIKRVTKIRNLIKIKTN